MPEKIPPNVLEGLEAELAGLEARLAATDADDERREGWTRRIGEVSEAMGQKRSKREKRPSTGAEKRPQE